MTPHLMCVDNVPLIPHSRGITICSIEGVGEIYRRIRVELNLGGGGGKYTRSSEAKVVQKKIYPFCLQFYQAFKV